MEISIYLDVVPRYCRNISTKSGKNHLIDTIVIYEDENHFPDIEGVELALVGVEEDRAAIDNGGCAKGPNEIRKSLYSLFDHWHNLKMVDLGNIKAGNAIADTYYALNQVLVELIKRHIIPIVIGGGQDLTLTMYKAFELTGNLINIAAVDSMFDIGGEGETLNSRSYLSHIIMHNPNYLFNFTNIGYQSYYVDPTSIDLMKHLLFEYYRLGDLKANIERTEPLIRNANLLTIDMNAFRAADAPGLKVPSPNGFNGEEACRMTRYAGMSMKMAALGIFEFNPEYDNNGITAALIAEMIWYFIDGFKNRQDDLPSGECSEFNHYIVQIEDVVEDVVFLCHKMTGRWWIDMSFLKNDDPLYERHHYIPCSREDYDTAMQNELPDKWWLFYQKMM